MEYRHEISQKCTLRSKKQRNARREVKILVQFCNLIPRNLGIVGICLLGNFDLYYIFNMWYTSEFSSSSSTSNQLLLNFNCVLPIHNRIMSVCFLGCQFWVVYLLVFLWIDKNVRKLHFPFGWHHWKFILIGLSL